MDSFVLLENSFYKNGSTILTQNFTNLIKKLNINTTEIKKINIGNKLLSLRDSYYQNLIKLLINISSENSKLIIYDSQSLIEINKLLKKLYKDSDFKEDLEQKIGDNIDIISIEKSITFAPEKILQAINKNTDSIKINRWAGFKCAIVIDRELEELSTKMHLIEQLESITGLKIIPFYRECYDYLLLTNKELALKLASNLYYEMVDSGIDFILSINIGNFELFDTYSKDIKKYAKRDDQNLPILFIPQILLALFEDTNRNTLLFDKHVVSPQML